MFKILGHDGREYGPISADVLRHWIAENRVNGETQVMSEGSSQWRPLRDVPEFSASVAAPPQFATPPSANSGINKVIPYRNVPALVGYYCAVFALIPIVGAVLGLIAVVLGIVGLRGAARNPAVGGKVHSWIAIILGGLCGFGYSVVLLKMISAIAHQR
jgi:hypothetical protein